MTDGASNTTSYGYDPAGRRTSITYPDGTQSTTTFDEAGRQTGQADLSATGSVLRSASAAYDGNGNMLSATDYRNDTTSYTYDATGLVASETQPVTSTSSITTSFGYDAAGNRTLFTDGNGSNWWTTYNSWNLPESQVEPATTAFPNAAQGTFTAAYDANANLTSLSEPGGVSITNTFNNMNQLTGQSGSGADAPTASRSFGYDLAGNLSSAATTAAGSAPATSETFTYNDRGQVWKATGSGGSTTFGYNGDGQAASVTDAAGTTSYTYDNAGRLATLADPLTGATAAYTYNPLSQVSAISYGTGGDVRSFGYNNLHQLTSDTLATSGGATVASIGYGYDPNGNLTGKTTTGFAGASASTYTYDQANRLASWNNGTSTVNYGYDGAGNLTKSGGKTLAYDARDQLASTTSGGTTTSYTYTARGTMATAGTANVSSDAYGQTSTRSGQSYGYDALGRLLTAAGKAAFTLSYQGTGSQISSDGAWNYAYDPAGGLTATGPAGGTQSQGTLAYTDAHTDVVGTFTPAGTTLAGSASYNPFGTVIASAGLAGNLGYQSGFTDPSTKLVHMGARWYSPATSQFTSKDTVTVNPVPDPAAANPFAYAGDSPLVNTDPTGHYAFCGGLCTGGHGPPPPRPAPHHYQPQPPPSCSPWSYLTSTCHYVNAWHHVVNGLHRLGHSFSSGVSWLATQADKAAAALAWARAQSARLVGDAIRTGKHLLDDAANLGAHAAATVISAAAHGARAVTQWAGHALNRAVTVLKTAYHAAAQAATATVTYIKHHAAAIASIAAGTLVFAGCLIATDGAGSIGCAMAAGAVANLVKYAMTCRSSATGCSVTGGLITAGTGALTWAASDGLGELAAPLTDTLLGGALSSEAQQVISATTTRTAITDSTASATGAAAEDTSTGLSDIAAAACGGESFTASTKVLLASGIAVPIASLRPGNKVLATSTKTGETKTETVTAVLVRQDTDLYDLKLRARTKTGVIDTTRSHLFWVPGSRGHGSWVKAGALKYGTHLRTSGGNYVTVLGGWTPETSSGWMWDLTVTPSHDFYIDTVATDVLVHNTSCPNPNGRLGGPAHQAEVGRIASDIENRGLTPQTEYRVETPGGFKPVRYVDVAGLDQKGNPVEFYQVGRQTAGGFPVMRESQAIWDIWSVSDVPVTFVPYP
jgi:RHS repeat-associated protein